MTITDSAAVDRRTFLRATGGAAALAATGSVASRPASAQATDLESWFEGVSNYDGVVDARGQDEVRVEVGAAGNGGAFGFGPAAVRVDPGTTVVWEWTGEGGSHNVAATDGDYESELVSDAGHTFEWTFDEVVVSRYVCVPHEAMGMRGAVVVGNAASGATGGSVAEPDYGGWFDDVSNFEGTVDARGQDEVRIAVGAEGNGGAFAFDPPAVRVDPGTTVVWEWTGEGGTHDVVDEATGYESPLTDEAGTTYALVFDGRGISKYACTPHEPVGMKGAVVVGAPVADDAEVLPGVSEDELPIVGLLLAAVLSPFAVAVLRGRRQRADAPVRPGQTARRPR